MRGVIRSPIAKLVTFGRSGSQAAYQDLSSNALTVMPVASSQLNRSGPNANIINQALVAAPALPSYALTIVAAVETLGTPPASTPYGVDVGSFDLGVTSPPYAGFLYTYFANANTPPTVPTTGHASVLKTSGFATPANNGHALSSASVLRPLVYDATASDLVVTMLAIGSGA